VARTSSKDQPGRASEIILYKTEDGRSQIQVRVEGETVWLTQAMIAELFQTSVPNINIHIRNVVEDNELSADATIKDHLIVRLEGSRRVRRSVKSYNLDMILAVGYRVRSSRGVQFRQWATELPVLGGLGEVSHQTALTWAEEQYDAFAERLRLEEESAGETRYLADLRDSAQHLQSERTQLAPNTGKRPKRRKKK
jgi:hypothetical protein